MLFPVDAQPTSNWYLWRNAHETLAHQAVWTKIFADIVQRFYLPVVLFAKVDTFAPFQPKLMAVTHLAIWDSVIRTFRARFFGLLETTPLTPSIRTTRHFSSPLSLRFLSGLYHGTQII